MENLNKYIELDKNIQILESKNVRRMYKEIKDKTTDIGETVKEFEKKCKEAKAKTAKEKKDVDQLDVKSYLNKKDFDKDFNKEESEYLEALNQEEVYKQQLAGVQQQKKEYEKKLAEVEIDKNELDKLQKEQDELLEKVFKGSYGSDKENELEGKLDNLLERQQRIKGANYKWTNARVLLQHAVTQFKFASTRWMEVKSQKNHEQQYVMATECRNNLIAAKQNVENAQAYIGKAIEFPYCKESEMKTLQTAIENIYTDIQPSRHSYASQCYGVTYKRAAALIQWFDQVINHTISKDLKNANEKVHQASRELRTERLQLLKAMAGDEGQSVNIEDTDKFDDNEQEPELLGLTQTAETEGEQRGGPTPMPLKDLAPPPSEEEIFGNMEQLKQQYEKMESEQKKTQEFNRARLNQGLEERLAARRDRRLRMQQKS